MWQNFLQSKKEKAEVIAFGNKISVLNVNAYLEFFRGQPTKNQAKNLGVILESAVYFQHIINQHIIISKTLQEHFVSNQGMEKLMYAFITSRVDYCNGLLIGLPKTTIKLQLIQNAAAYDSD